jgi:hypothetical protein
MEENLISCNYVGGLGNQIFCIYATVSYALKFNKKAIFLCKDESPSITHRITYWNSLFKNLETCKDFDNKLFVSINDDEYTEKNIEKNKQHNILLNGHFQSKLCFINEIDKINDILDIKSQREDVKNKTFNKYLNKRLIGLHFRLGDYKKYQHVHPLLPDKYYINSLNEILVVFNLELQQSYKILVFCEEEDYKEVERRMKNIVSNINYVVDYEIVKEGTDLDQMFMISLCDYIIMANSTFSWWSAIFSGHNNVFIPYIWVCGQETHENVVLEGWNIVKF